MIILLGMSAKLHSFANFGLGQLVRFANVCNVGGLFEGRRKKQNKSPQICTKLSTNNFLFYTCIQLIISAPVHLFFIYAP